MVDPDQQINSAVFDKGSFTNRFCKCRLSKSRLESLEVVGPRFTKFERKYKISKLHTGYLNNRVQ